MGEGTKISWTDNSWSPWWGCTKVSAGCDNCYADTFAHRLGMDVWGKDADRRFFGDKHWNEPRRWNRAAAEAGRPTLVFCASMCDVFEPRDDLDGQRARLWNLIEETPFLIWQLLTKRPEYVPSLAPREWMRGDWPGHVWIGTTVEDQPHARLRIPRLLKVPAPVRFLSCEPLLGRVDLSEWLFEPYTAESSGREAWLPKLDWVIVGGESGNGFRPLELGHARVLRNQCREADVPMFFKQVGGRTPTAGGDVLDGEVLKAFPSQARR